jgi:uncharacterized repeat protein (TIGR03803 family)
MKKLLLSTFFALGSSLFTLCSAQYTDMFDFNGTTGTGEYPTASLTLSGGVLYGMTYEGGIYNSGNVFSIDTNGNNFKDLWDFYDTSNNGALPHGSLTIIGNKLYGTTSSGGLHNNGIIFSINTNGTDFKDMFDFNQQTTGETPDGSLTLSGGKLYGMVFGGGANALGDLFSIDTNGSNFTDIFDFNSTTGQAGYGSLAVSPNGNMLFGMSTFGGAYSDGMVFSVASNGSYFKDVLDFVTTNGSLPNGSLLLNGNVLYGMTEQGGLNRDGCVFSIDSNGANYKDMHDFNGTDGLHPYGDLVLGPLNMLYGMTYQAGTYTNGNIFSINADGSNFTSMYLFQTATGANPLGNLTIAGNAFYGMAEYFGANQDGVIFRYKDPAALGVDNVTANPGAINLYPNPNKGIFTITFNKVAAQGSQAKVEVYNVLGEKVYSQLNSQQSAFNIDLSSQPSGVYFYKVLQENGELVGGGKFVIE